MLPSPGDRTNVMHRVPAGPEVVVHSTAPVVPTTGISEWNGSVPAEVGLAGVDHEI
jgi:hypothetical protein